MAWHAGRYSAVDRCAVRALRYVLRSAALLTKPDPRSALGWIVTCWLLPFAGTILYLLFGVNRVRTRARQLRAGLAIHRQRYDSPPADDFATQLTRIGDAVTQRPRVPGNQVVALENGENAFPLMLEAIRTARHSVWLSTYIFETDAVGRQFIDALAATAARGVQVHVLVDGIGEWYSWPHAVRLLRHAGVHAARFLPPGWRCPCSRSICAITASSSSSMARPASSAA